MATLPEMIGDQAVMDSVVKRKKPKLREAVQITLDLAAQGVIDPDKDPAADKAVSKRQYQAIARVQKFLDKALLARDEGRI